VLTSLVEMDGTRFDALVARYFGVPTESETEKTSRCEG
jgi:hypothetical protein